MRSGQETREEFLVAESLPKNRFQKSGEAVDLHEANPLISTHKAFSRSWVAGFRAGKLTAVADKNLTRDERVWVPARRACQRLKSDAERQANCHEKVAQAIFYGDKQQAREAIYQSMQEFWQDGASKEEQKWDKDTISLAGRF